jgi:hypothetical protein
MLYFVRSTCPNYDECFAVSYNTRQEFLTDLRRYNGGGYPEQYQEIPRTCVDRLFGSRDWEPGLSISWPKGKP